MKKLLIILIAFIGLSSCKSIQCKYNARKAVKHQEKAAQHIEKLVLKGCDFEIDSILKARTISVLRDTIVEVKERYIEVPSDELVFEQAVRCDSLGRVVLDLERRIQRKPKFIKGEVVVKDNIIRVKCSLDSAVHQIAIRDTTIIQLRNEIESLNENKVTLKEQPKSSFWDDAKGFLIWVVILIVIAIIARIVYYKLKL